MLCTPRAPLSASTSAPGCAPTVDLLWAPFCPQGLGDPSRLRVPVVEPQVEWGEQQRSPKGSRTTSLGGQVCGPFSPEPSEALPNPFGLGITQENEPS